MTCCSEFNWTGWRSYKLINRTKECKDVVSFFFEPADEAPIPLFKAGQVVALKAEGFCPKSFVLCGTPNGKYLRLTVKCFNAKGDPLSKMTNYLYHLAVGDTVEMSAPTGDFVLEPRTTQLVLIAEGIGIVPALAFASEISTNSPMRPVNVLYSALNSNDFPLKNEIRAIIDLIPKAGLGVFFRDPLLDDDMGKDYNVFGPLSVDKIRSVCFDPEADFYVAGGRKFVEDIKEGLIKLNIIPSRIRTMIMSEEN